MVHRRIVRANVPYNHDFLNTHSQDQLNFQCASYIRYDCDDDILNTWNINMFNYLQNIIVELYFKRYIKQKILKEYSDLKANRK